MTLGQVVYSKAGRDAGKKFIILERVDENYVLVSDGYLRRIERPKKKKLKHLEFTSDVITSLNEKLMNKSRITNSELRKALDAYEKKENQEM